VAAAKSKATLSDSEEEHGGVVKSKGKGKRERECRKLRGEMPAVERGADREAC
jgi:hypothetical protein